MKLGRQIFCLLSAPLALGLVSCSDATKKAEAGSTPAPPREVRVTRAEIRPMERTVQVVGTLSAHDETTMAAQVAGQIEGFRVDLGDRVKAGQELALIDTAAYEALAAQAAANLAKAQASAANAAQNLKRVQELQQDKIASTSELDQAVAEAEQAKAEVKAAEAANAIAQLNLERSRVRSPFDGAVAQRIATVGSYVGVGAPILRVVKTDPLRLRLEVPERQSVAIRVGQPVRVRVEGDTNIYRGSLERVAPSIRDSDRMLLVEADVPNRGALRAGLFARAEIVVNESEPGIAIPLNSLITFAGLEKVVTIKDGKAEERTVATGRRGPDWVEIVSGLKAGELVVLEPTGIRTGQPLTIVQPAETSAGGDERNVIGRGE